MSDAVSKGTRFANYMRDRWLRRIWPTADRAALKGVKDDADFVNCGKYMVEAKWRKSTKAWRIAGWVAVLRTKEVVHCKPWVLVCAEDMRHSRPIMVLDADHGFHLLELEARHELFERLPH